VEVPPPATAVQPAMPMDEDDVDPLAGLSFPPAGAQAPAVSLPAVPMEGIAASPVAEAVPAAAAPQPPPPPQAPPVTDADPLAGLSMPPVSAQPVQVMDLPPSVPLGPPEVAVPTVEAKAIAPDSVAAGLLSEAPAVAGGEAMQVEPAGVAGVGDVSMGSEAPVQEAAEIPPPPAPVPVVEEPVGELEEDAPEDTRASLKEPICFHTRETTMNVLPSSHGTILMAFSDGGLQYIMGGARASVGLTGGRYMFEVTILELLTPPETTGPGIRQNAPHPRHALRIGFSLSGSTLVLGESEDGFCFDSEGVFMCEGKQTLDANRKFTRDAVLTLVLNLDKDSPNANTVSLFRDGVRMSSPQPIPERFQGKPLFPHVVLRNVSLQVNFGPVRKCNLPFSCTMVQSAAQEDTVAAPQDVSASQKCEVCFPICFPDEGAFDWTDQFLEAHPEYQELSDRSILDWATKSGCVRSRGSQQKGSNDRPEWDFGLPQLDDQSCRRTIYSLAQVQKRNYIVMEVKGNLMKADRAEMLQRFSAPYFKKVAYIMVGTPPDDFKEMRAKKAEARPEAAAALTDLTESALSSSFSSFSIPSKDEGFDEVKYLWLQDEASCQEHLKKWVKKMKVTTKMEDIEPCEWFHQRLHAWNAQKDAWHHRFNEYKDPARRAAVKAQKEAQLMQQQAQGVEVDGKALENGESAVEDPDLDVFGVEDVCDVQGSGVPLFALFVFEDWALMSLRFELHLLIHSFKKDVTDPERVGIHPDNLPFYYTKYFKKTFSARNYGVESCEALVSIIEDTIIIDDDRGVLESLLAEELDSFDVFVKLTEEGRRERQRLVDSGDESAKLKFVVPQVPAAGWGGAMPSGSQKGPYGKGSQRGAHASSGKGSRSEPYMGKGGSGGCKGYYQGGATPPPPTAPRQRGGGSGRQYGGGYPAAPPPPPGPPGPPPPPVPAPYAAHSY